MKKVILMGAWVFFANPVYSAGVPFVTSNESEPKQNSTSKQEANRDQVLPSRTVVAPLSRPSEPQNRPTMIRPSSNGNDNKTTSLEFDKKMDELSAIAQEQATYSCAPTEKDKKLPPRELFEKTNACMKQQYLSISKKSLDIQSMIQSMEKQR